MDEKESKEIKKDSPDKDYFSDILEKEEEISDEAYDLVEHAMSLIDSKYFDDALEALTRAIDLYMQINAEEEIKAIKEKMAEINLLKEPKETESKLVEEKVVASYPVETVEDRELQQEEALDEKTKRILDYQMRKQEEENFKIKISQLVEKAENLNRNYEIAMKKAIKDGKLADNPPFLEIIEIYENTRQMVFEKDWKDQLELYTNQIELYQKKMEQDDKLREIEAQKVEGDFQQKIADMVDYAERLAREYDIAFKKAVKGGILKLEPVYPVVINIYEKIRDMLIEKGWNDQAETYTEQLKYYGEKLASDNKIRVLEAQKVQKQKEFEELQKTQVVEKATVMEDKKKKDEVDFQQKIADMVDYAERLAREYDIAFKKAVKGGILKLEPVYPVVINIYEKIRDMLIEKGWNDQAETYTEQLEYYGEKLVKDNKIRELEAQKIQKQKEYEESLKIAKKEVIVEKHDIPKQKPIKSQELLESDIYNLIDKADKIERAYEMRLKKTIKKSKLVKKCPYPTIIKILEEKLKELD